jgi:hypothetical protein
LTILLNFCNIVNMVNQEMPPIQPEDGGTIVISATELRKAQDEAAQQMAAPENQQVITYESLLLDDADAAAAIEQITVDQWDPEGSELQSKYSRDAYRDLAATRLMLLRSNMDHTAVEEGFKDEKGQPQRMTSWEDIPDKYRSPKAAKFLVFKAYSVNGSCITTQSGAFGSEGGAVGFYKRIADAEGQPLRPRGVADFDVTGGIRILGPNDLPRIQGRVYTRADLDAVTTEPAATQIRVGKPLRVRFPGENGILDGIDSSPIERVYWQFKPLQSKRDAVKGTINIATHVQANAAAADNQASALLPGLPGTQQVR